MIQYLSAIKAHNKFYKFRGVAKVVSRQFRVSITALGVDFSRRAENPWKHWLFSALPNVEKSLNLRSDHMFDHLQKNRIFLPHRGVAKVVSRIVRDDEIAGSSPVTSTKKQPKISHFDLFSAVFLYILLKNDSLGLTTCLPWFRTFDCCFTAIFPLFQKIPFLCLLRCNFWGLTVYFPSALCLSTARQIGIW